MSKHLLISSKMKKTGPLLSDPFLHQYVPELHWLNRDHLRRMLFTHSTVYIKPNTGSQGLGIRRLRLLNHSSCEITDLRRSRKMSITNAMKSLYKELDPRVPYLVQQGIDLATYNRRPFHIRVVLLKPVDSWQLTMMTGIMARQKNAVVTNESRGGVQKSIEEILYNYDQKRNPSQTFRELIDLSHQIANRIGSQLPLLLLGLDMAIDKRGKIWFIEANTLPDMSGMRELNDRISFYKYREAKKRIGLSTLLYSLRHR